MEHFEILKVGAELNERFWMMGAHWGSKAHKFLDLGEAVKEQRKHANAYIIWVDKSKNPPHGSWGEVNRDHIAKTF